MLAVVRDRGTEFFVEAAIAGVVAVWVIYFLLRVFRRGHDDGNPPKPSRF
jgi:hypothetical protein